MTAIAPVLLRVASVARTLASSSMAVWAAFVLVHLWLGLLNLWAPGLPLGDVTIVYKFWMDQALIAQYWMGIDTVWVYPIVALVPMLAAYAFVPEQYAATWLSMIMVLNAVAFGFLTGWGRSRERVAVAWWWVAFLFLLGPIALGRIDSVTVPLAIIGVLLIARSPVVATVVLTVATWIKVWPAALIAAAVIALRGRLRIVATALLASALIMIVALTLGSGAKRSELRHPADRTRSADRGAREHVLALAARRRGAGCVRVLRPADSHLPDPFRFWCDPSGGRF